MRYFVFDQYYNICLSAFRSNQAYAPCQKAAHDTDEFDCKLPDISCQRRHVNTLSGLPLSQEPPKQFVVQFPLFLNAGYYLNVLCAKA